MNEEVSYWVCPQCGMDNHRDLTQPWRIYCENCRYFSKYVK
jgi:ribosomal protein S27AE